MNVYDEFRPVAVELLGEFGSSATLTRVTAGATGLTKRSKLGLDVEPVSTTTTIQTTAVKLEDEQNVVAGVTVTLSSVMLLDEPFEGDTLAFAGVNYTIGKVTPTDPQGVGILWEAVIS